MLVVEFSFVVVGWYMLPNGKGNGLTVFLLI